MLPAAVSTMAVRKASCRSAARAISGMAKTRASKGAASTRPIICGSSPLAFSHTGKKGSWIPDTTNMAA